MHPAGVDPRLPCSNLSSSTSANGSGQLGGSDAELNPVGGGENEDIHNVNGGSVWPEALVTDPEPREDSEATGYPSWGDSQAVDQDCCQPVSRSTRPFQKWMRTLHKRALRRQGIVGCDGAAPAWLSGIEDGDSEAGRYAHYRYSSSDSSFAFVTGIKSPSISMAGVSLLTRSRKTTTPSSRGPRTDRSSRASLSGARHSEDSCCPERQVPVDPAVVQRALQRRHILEELISTEESYIGDVRFLMNVYITILASLPTSPAALRTSVNRNLNDIVELHDELLGELHRAMPDSEYTQPDVPIHRTQLNHPARDHRHRKSLDVVPEGRDGGSWLGDVPGMVAEPQTAAEVAKIFLKRMNRFFIYEEYGAKYEMMIKDVAAAHRTMPGWSLCQKGLEVLASSLDSADSHDDHSRKALTIGDLLVKPIQRVCKYPLLFSELLKYTPVIDCPHSHMEIENTLIRIREATAEINRATNDSRTKSVLEKTWILQDRLAFPDQQLDAASKNRIRAFGHLRVCGALHVCWQTKEGASGQYMVALLYREWLCLATASRADQIYTIQACITLANINVEDVDNGRGLQCHTARHSWKIVFLSDNQLYELILTACSPKEELEWCSRLKNSQDAASPASHDQMQSDIFSFLALNIKPLGTVFRKPGTMARKISIHRATTIGPKSPLYQVILKNTSAAHERSTSSQSINRSQSLLTTTTRTPVLAPARAERARLEALLSDVWTRDVLPFPGITARSRSEHLVRASASSVMRRLSAVNITGSFTRRSQSLASLQQKDAKPTAAPYEVTRRASDGTFTITAAATAQYQDEDTCPSAYPSPSPALSAVAGHPPSASTFHPVDSTADSNLEPDPDLDLDADAEAEAEADGLEMVSSRGHHHHHQRPSSAPESTKSGRVPSLSSSVTRSRSSGANSSASPRGSFQVEGLGEMTETAAAVLGDGGVELEMEGVGMRGEKMGVGLAGIEQGQERGGVRGGGRLSGKLGKVGRGRRREILVEGIRSWFR